MLQIFETFVVGTGLTFLVTIIVLLLMSRVSTKEKDVNNRTRL